MMGRPMKNPNALTLFFKGAQRARHLTDEQLAKLVFLSKHGVGQKYNRGHWNNEDIKLWCKALNIKNAKALGEAILAENETENGYE